MALTKLQIEAFKRYRSMLSWAATGGTLDDEALDEYGVIHDEARIELAREAVALKALAEATDRALVLGRATESAADFAQRFTDALGSPNFSPLEFDEFGEIVSSEEPDPDLDFLSDIPRLAW